MAAAEEDQVAAEGEEEVQLNSAKEVSFGQAAAFGAAGSLPPFVIVFIVGLCLQFTATFALQLAFMSRSCSALVSCCRHSSTWPRVFGPRC